MTCIVGIIDSEARRVIIGGDSAETCDQSRFIRKDVKVFRNGKFIFGCTSSFRMIQLLQYSLRIPDVPEGWDMHKYMCIAFITAVKECFKEGGYLQKFTDGDDKGGTFLVGYEDRLFKIQCDFQVSENLCGYDAIGSGGDFALGSLFTTVGNPNITNRLLEALRAAESLAVGVSSPFVTLTT